jgi:hypothetical protein
VARPGWLAGVVVSTLLLAGCSGDEPTAGPPKPAEPPTSPVTTTSPTPAPPVLPAAARENSKAGAVAFAHHYIDLINYASGSGDVRGLRAVSGPRCASCQNFVSILRDLYRGGGFVQGGEWTVESYSVIAAGPPKIWLVSMNLSAAPQLVHPGADAPSDRRAGGKFAASLYAEWAGSWRVWRLVRDR